MLVSHRYNRDRALRYARTWATARNPLFLSFTGIGGDCTNFVSQCVYAGCCVMNFEQVYGWYYVNPVDRTASWTGVQYFYDFMTKNKGVGPYGIEIPETMLMQGDIIQLGMGEDNYYHAMIVTGFEETMPLVSAHSNDAQDRKLDTYTYEKIRCIRIIGARTDILDPQNKDCYEKFLTGEKL